ncbi:deoxyribodipyrimidine photo-lyase [Pseudomonas sp. N040]|uniref:deoxyribodipyrimidine photo-lyase n=1 Tax=Pseudomonas sp. N040 TaxID=2785325 RepID=UPI0018A2E575|nr:deoxyribodipyrimidine photo-lyase [Pseudomonas sp. N040]MBF7730547.1 deoxyribodipyrimidine photo-lyase [Pseudomonas sp. N040]MBW7014191.1 deoxyribodipyrimidine photo-lyase [Pseudomonas sp. N040]
MTQLLWLRSDLRVTDNTALCAAMASGPTLAVYIITPGQWLAHDDAACKVDFWLRNLASLRDALARLNVPLLLRQCDRWDEVPAVLLHVCTEQQVAALHCNAEYGIHEERRDQASARLLEQHGIGFAAHLDQLLLQPGSLLTQAGNYFQVFSQFRKVCQQRLHRSLPACLPAPPAQAPLPLASDTVPASVPGFAVPAESLRLLWPAGEAQAQRRLQQFADEQMDAYDRQRDLPAVPGTSQLSAYLAAGVLSPRQCLHAALRVNRGEFDSGNPGVVCWVNELLWREFYKHVLVGYPRVSRHRAFRVETEYLGWRHAPDELAAWQDGRTGIPLVDAAMRQLRATGWMHNRLRMVVAMFLTKNLLIDWREGERFFMRHLIDGDLAANNGGWQWSASTGTDAVPYFRLFNPLSQAQRFDAEGRFIRHWLPELADLSDRDLHNPAALGGLFGALDYPPPMVDLSASRERALQAFKHLPKFPRESLHV